MAKDAIYFLQLPYLNESGAAVCITIERRDAERLQEMETHRLIADDGVVIVTPVQRAVTGHTFQRGCEAY